MRLLKVGFLSSLIFLIMNKTARSIDKNEESLDYRMSGAYDYLVYAASWQPTFCLLNKNSSGCDHPKSEFRTHGIWPYYNSIGSKTNRHPSYCTNSPGCPDEKNCPINDSVLSFFLDNKSFLDVVPYDPKKLMEHEWEKHGSCYGEKQVDYFNDFVRFHHAVKYKHHFLDSIGETLSFATFKKWFPKNTSFRCGFKESQQYLFEVFYLMDKNGMPYLGDPDLQIGKRCSRANITISAGDVTRLNEMSSHHMLRSINTANLEKPSIIRRINTNKNHVSPKQILTTSTDTAGIGKQAVTSQVIQHMSAIPSNIYGAIDTYKIDTKSQSMDIYLTLSGKRD